MTAPLTGTRVLDLGAGMAGAICTMVLADYGAEVVRVEPPGGGPARRSGAAATWDRGKRSLVANLADPDDVALLRRLALGADVVIEGWAPGVAGQLELDYPDLSLANQKLVYCRLAAYGPKEADDGLASQDLLGAARLGVMGQMPGHRDGPIAPGSPTLTYSTGLMAAIAALAAVRARLVTGLGDRVEVSQEDGFLVQRTMGWRSERGANFIATKSRGGVIDLGRLRLIIRMFECAGGGRVQLHTGGAGAFARAMRVLGLADRVSRPDGPQEMATPLTEEDLAVLGEMPAIFKARTADEWCERFWAAEVACLPVLAPGIAFNDPQVRHAGLMRTIEDPDLGEIEVVGPVAHFSASPGDIAGPAPRLDQDAVALRADGWRSAGLAAEGRSGQLDHPLQGIRVVEISSYFASPFGCRLLASLGAEVIKLEPAGGDLFRAMPDPFEGANWGGKRAIALNLKAPEAREITAALLARADVVQSNMRPGAAERLGVDYEAARRANPGVIYEYSPGYGSTGPKAHLQAFAPLMGGFTGLLTLFGGPGNSPHMGFGNEDYFGGEVVAISTLLALIHRDRTGEGQYVEAPLLHSTLLTTSEWYLKDGEPRTQLAQLDKEQMGFGWGHRIYQCLDGWIAVACLESEEREALLREVLPAHPDQDGDEAIAAALAYAFFGSTVEEWLGRLRGVGAPCALVVETDYYDEYLGTDELVPTGRIFEFDHRSAGRVRGPDLLYRASRHPGVRGAAAPLLGADSRLILGELGFASKASDLIGRGIVIAAGEAADNRAAAAPAMART